MDTHDRLDSFGSFISIVEWDGRYVVVENVCFDNSMQEVTSNEAKLSVNGSSSSTSKVPSLWLVMRKRRIGVLEESNSDC
jgi:hypothetical protein